MTNGPDLNYLKNFLELVKSLGVKSIKTDKLEVVFTPQESEAITPDKFNFGGDSETTEDEMLLWSTPAFDELKSSRKEESPLDGN